MTPKGFEHTISHRQGKHFKYDLWTHHYISPLNFTTAGVRFDPMFRSLIAIDLKLLIP